MTIKSSNQIVVGDRFDFWEVIEVPSKGPLICKCIGCQEQKIQKLHKYQLVRGLSKSCGCQKFLLLKETMIKNYGVENAAHSLEIRNKTIETNLKKYGTKYSCQNNLVIEKKKKTNLDRYGFENPTLKNSEIKKRQEETMLTKYGSKHALQNQEIKDRMESTILERYGTKKLHLVEEFIENKKKTNIERYGFDTPLKNQDVRKKIEETNLAKYGVKNPAQNNQIRLKTINTNLERYGKESTNLCNIFLSNGEALRDYCKELKIDSSYSYRVFREHGEKAFLAYCKSRNEPSNYLEKIFIDLLKDHFPEIRHHNRSPLEFSYNRKPDFRLEKNGKLLYINLDGLYWHCEEKKQRDYHFNYRNLFNSYGINIFQIRENEVYFKSQIVRSIILNYFNLTQNKIHARKCTVEKLEVSKAKEFFDKNHLMGGKQKTPSYGLFYNNELVAAMSVKKKTENALEIIRFCSKLETSISGGFSKLLNKIIKEFNPSQIVSFCDLRYSTGQSYEKLGFEKKSISLGFEWTDKINTFNRLRCRANMDSRKLSQKQQAKEFGWLKIYDAGQALYRKDIL